MPPLWPISGLKLWYRAVHKIFSTWYLKIMSILVQTKVGSSCPPLLGGKRPWVSLPLLLTCRGDWVGWEPQGGTGAVRHPMSHVVHGQKWKGLYVPVLMSSFQQPSQMRLLPSALQHLRVCPPPCPGDGSAKHTASGCTWGCKLSCVAACLCSWEGSSGLSPCQKQTPSLVGKALIRTSL